MERSIRDIKSYEKAMRRQVGQKLKKRIEAAVHDLNEERPRPVLGGETAREVFKSKRMNLPDRRKFYLEVKRMEKVLASNSCSRRQEENAGRNATEKVLLRYGLMKEITDMSTYLKTKTGTC